MPLDPTVCYRALRTRDARFDGRFYTAVRSTGIYCRPICPARTPRLENCLFLPHAAAAQEAGYRPCLRCRPEASPGTPAWAGTSTTVSRALQLIDEGALDEGSVGDLAARLGIGERHLRRLFLEHVGASPVSVSQTRRMLFAKKLLNETALPMSDVAFAAGYASVRRFNAAIREGFRRSPRELRGAARKTPAADSSLELQLPFRPPYPWRAVSRYLAARATAGVETATDERYGRSFLLDGVPGVVEVRPAADGPRLVARLHLAHPVALIRVAERLRALFDLAADPTAIARELRRDPRLRASVRALPGVRVPGAWDGFELTVRTILGQQVSVAGATTLAGRLAAAHGEKLAPELADEIPGLTRLFPTPESLADADLTKIGLTRARAGAIRALAREVADGNLVLAPGPDPEDTMARLCALPGVGPWTAEYVAMRVLREPDAFPATDLGLRRALDLPTRELLEAAEQWRPWRSYAAMLLWQRPAPKAKAS